ncbi:hypothetical protein QYE76_036846 [Lolium multiflorum]|uniref:DUF4219 domain-containing protein n=1 Tax=Lolium multiflorum TaxID=4521 RepID=A0AAD8VQL5_LOLMU|nr:hypothetical protein QYE76_036846 [Lolium multiflorum]
MGEYSGVAAPVSTQYPRYIRDNYTVWATTMEWALESNEIWEAVDPGGDEFKKGASKYRNTGGKRAFGSGSQLPLVAVAQPRSNKRD